MFEVILFFHLLNNSYVLNYINNLLNLYNYINQNQDIYDYEQVYMHHI